MHRQFAAVDGNAFDLLPWAAGWHCYSNLSGVVSMTLESARDAENAGEFRRAAALYEELLGDGHGEPAVVLGLALVYWQSTDPGIAASLNFDAEQLALAERRCAELLAEAAQRWPNRTDAYFWPKYIAWADRGAPLEMSYCKELLRQNPSILVPAMYVFIASEGAELREETRQLVEQCTTGYVPGSGYIMSVLQERHDPS